MMPSRKRPVVVVTRRLPHAVETRMRELFDTRLNIDDKPLETADLVEAVRTADVLVPTVTDQINASVLAQAGPNLTHQRRTVSQETTTSRSSISSSTSRKPSGNRKYSHTQ